MNIPLVSDPKHTIAQDYGVLKVDEGISFRYVPALWGLTSELYDWLRALYLVGDPLSHFNSQLY